MQNHIIYIYNKEIMQRKSSSNKFEWWQLYCKCAQHVLSMSHRLLKCKKITRHTPTQNHSFFALIVVDFANILLKTSFRMRIYVHICVHLLHYTRSHTD